LISEQYAKKALKNEFKFTDIGLEKLSIYYKEVIKFNKSYNLIGKSTENSFWSRHILDSAQLIKFFKFSENSSISDLGTGAGFPGIVISLANKKSDFHVKLYEKSPIKVEFLNSIIKKLNIERCHVIQGNVMEKKIESEIIVCRAFKKLDEIIKFSRENCQKPHKMLILKGKNAQADVNNALTKFAFKYKLYDSITDKKSKILVIDA